MTLFFDLTEVLVNTGEVNLGLHLTISTTGQLIVSKLTVYSYGIGCRSFAGSELSLTSKSGKVLPRLL